MIDVSQRNGAAPTGACPDPERLATLLTADPMPPDPALQAHLDGCAACQRRLEALVTAGDRWDEVAPQLAAWSADADTEAWGLADTGPALRDVLIQLQALDPQTAALRPADETPDLGVLAPSETPGSLGRLGEYEIQGVIGHGGMGVVFRGLDPALDRVVAIKALAPHLNRRAEARQRFLREARLSAAVSHENVVAIHGVAESNGTPFLVMQYVEGESLQQRLGRVGPLPPIDVVRIGLQVARGLAAAHARGIVHRDIKPANILLAGAGTAPVSAELLVKITDFGLARVGDSPECTESGVAIGTPAFMSPEQAQGKPLDARSDLFSLGSVLYALGAGRPPFHAEQPLALVRLVADHRPTPLTRLNPAVPPWLADLIARLHERDPAGRPCAAAVAAYLERGLAHLEHPDRVPPPGRPVRPARRRWLVAAGLLLLIGLGAAGAFRRWPPEAARRDPDPHGPGGAAAVAVTDNQKMPPPVVQAAPGLPQFAPRTFLLMPGPVPHLAQVGPGMVAPHALRHARLLHGHQGAVHAITVSNDSRLALSSTAWPRGDGTIRRWDLERAVQVRTYDAPGDIGAVVLSPDNRWFVTASRDGTARVRDVETGVERCCFNGHRGEVSSAAWSPDGTRIATCGTDNAIRLWDAATGQELRVFEGHAGAVAAIAFSPDGKRLLSGAHDFTMRLWDVADGTELRRIDFTRDWVTDVKDKWVSSVAFSRDGKRALAGEMIASVWDLETGKELHQYKGTRFGVIRAVFSPNERLVLLGNYDGSVCLYDAETEARLRVLRDQSEFIWAVAFTPDGRSFLSGGGGMSLGDGSFSPGHDFAIRLWDLNGLLEDEAASSVKQ